ncbi:MAG: hypothetical protein M1833_002592 [Piccolia ochrophora]|nr:MAG: hypothetical protein M1833_002592 [Piccolia ochrophora]
MSVLRAMLMYSKDRKIPGYITGYVRRFWQHAVNNEKVWGMAYRIAPSKVEEVQSYLDIREINGYSIHFVPFRPADPAESLVRTMVYIGTPDNAQFVGPQDPQALAEHISQSRGPSGDNKEYLFMLEESLETLSRDSGDEHVRDLAVRVREIEQTRAQTLELSSTVMPPVTKFRSGGSTDEQEEVEKQ